MSVGQPPVFLSDGEVKSLEKKSGEALLINVGRASTFSNLPPKQREVVSFFLRILTSPSFEDAHQEVTHDNLLPSALRLIVDKRIDEATRRQVAQGINAHYGNDQLTHWQQTAILDGNAVNSAFLSYPDYETDKTTCRGIRSRYPNS